MRGLLSILVAALASVTFAGAVSCGNCTNDSPEPIEIFPAPWKLRGDVYGITLLSPILGRLALPSLPKKYFPPSERPSVRPDEGYAGELGMLQLIRYTESPCGPYDELLLIPGFFTYQENGKNHTAPRVTRIYVSQTCTCANGRELWQIPKHLAQFNWTDHSNGSSSVKVYPYDTEGDKFESQPAKKPWFMARFDPITSDTVPYSTDIYSFLGVDATLVQPPLKRINDSFGVLVGGGDKWKATFPRQNADRSVQGIMDLRQWDHDTNATGLNAVGDEYFPNFLKDQPRYNGATKLLNATITFSAPRDIKP